MKRLNLEIDNKISKILVGEKFSNLKKYIPDKKVFFITDENLFKIYKHEFEVWPTIVIGSGEKSKTIETAQNIYTELLKIGVDRFSFLIGVGGGIVSDITGFVASTFMRGIPFGFVSTSLLSQVDASVGGKNGVNFLGYKNIIGTFNQPDFVICDTKMLSTLPEKEFNQGFSEVIKHAIIEGKDSFKFLESLSPPLSGLKEDVLKKIIYDSIRIKAEIVQKDEREHGERRKLNFGHTFAHAIEKTSKLSHGEAVLLGMLFSLKISYGLGMLSSKSLDRAICLIKKFGFPGELNGDKSEILKSVRKDKKKENDHIYFVFSKGIGRVIVKKIPYKELERVYNDMC